MNIPILLQQLEDDIQGTPDDSFDEDVVVCIIPTEFTDEYLIEEIFIDPQTSTITPTYAARCRLWSQPNVVWGSQRLPLEITSYGPVMGSNNLSKGYDVATAGVDLNLRWTIGTYSDPGGDRRDLPYSKQLGDVAFTQSMRGRHIQLFNEASQTYLIQNDNSWGLRTIGDVYDASLAAIPGATLPNSGATAPDDSIFIISEYGDGMSYLGSTINSSYQLGNGTTLVTNQLHNQNGWYMTGAAEDSPNSGMTLIKIDGTSNFHLSFPSSSNEEQYLAIEYHGVTPSDQGVGFAHLCLESKLADYSWDLQNALSNTTYPTPLSKALALSSWQIIEVPVVVPVTNTT